MLISNGQTWQQFKEQKEEINKILWTGKVISNGKLKGFGLSKIYWLE